MSDKFAMDVIEELNNFRANPKSVQHQCEVISKGLSRFKPDDPFIKDVNLFIKSLEKLKPLPKLEYNKTLSEAAEKELPNFRGDPNYQKYRKGKSVRDIVPDYYLIASPALVADEGAEEPKNVIIKILLNKEDASKEGRKIICESQYTQVGIAHEVFKEDNMVILIFATTSVEKEPIQKSLTKYVKNIQYHESKYIKKPKYEVIVSHRIKGDIVLGNFIETIKKTKIYSQGESRPKLEQNVTQKLKGNKSEVKLKTKTMDSKAKIPTTVTAKKEKITETTVKRRNEGKVTKTETKTETKTTVTGVRGQPKSRVTTKTTK